MMPPLWRTVRHLRVSQVLWRLLYAAERRLARVLPRGRWAWRSPGLPGLRGDLPSVPRTPTSALRGTPAVDELARGVFDLLNRRGEIGRERPDWQLGARSEDRLWTVTLHCHEWIDAIGRASPESEQAAALARHYLSDWIRRCALDQPGAAALAWNAYAVATRLGWWIRAWAADRDRRIFAPGSELERSFLESLWEQAAYLYDHIEWDLRGNHLVRDAAGLAWAGRFFTGPEPAAWLRRASSLALEQVEEQILPDGGHFERSPRYHVDVMEDLFVLAFLLEDPELRTRIRRAWTGMAGYLAWMRHPDGDVPLFNDGSLLGGEAVNALLHLGERIGVRVDPSPRRGGKHFSDTGTAVWHGDPWCLFFDAAPVGPDEQPGHAHADTLSIETSFEGLRVFVDPGTYAYDDDGRRRYDRSTRAHNTLEVDGTDSSEMWRIFRVGRRARPSTVRVEILADRMKAAAAHDGYAHLGGEPRHLREVEVTDHGPLVLVDRVTGGGAHSVRGGLLVAPPWEVEETEGGWSLACGRRHLRVALEGAGTALRSRETRPYHPRYGVEQEATRIGWRWQGTLPFEIRTVVGAP